MAQRPGAGSSCRSEQQAFNRKWNPSLGDHQRAFGYWTAAYQMLERLGLPDAQPIRANCEAAPDYAALRDKGTFDHVLDELWGVDAPAGTAQRHDLGSTVAATPRGTPEPSESVRPNRPPSSRQIRRPAPVKRTRPRPFDPPSSRLDVDQALVAGQFVAVGGEGDS